MKNAFLNTYQKTRDAKGLLILSQGENDRLTNQHVRQITEADAQKLLSQLAEQDRHKIYKLDLGLTPREDRSVWVAPEHMIFVENKPSELALEQDDYTLPRHKVGWGGLKR